MKDTKPLPKTSYLRQCFDVIDGTLMWKVRPRSHFVTDRAYSSWNGRYANTVAGTFDKDGYRVVKLDYMLYKVSRICYALYHGICPVRFEIDHKNGSRDDNSFGNLVLKSRILNVRNRALGSNNNSGYVGVFWHSQSGKFEAGAYMDGRRVYLGRFATAEEAARARDIWMSHNGAELGYTERHGKQ